MVTFIFEFEQYASTRNPLHFKMGISENAYNRYYMHLLPTEGEERVVFGAGSIPVAILPACQDMKTIAV